MKTVVMNVTRPISPTASHVKGTTVTIEDDLAEYYISTGAARYATLQQTDARLLRSSIDGSPGSIVAPGGEAAGVNIATDASGNTVLVGGDGQRIKTAYKREVYSVRGEELIDFGAADFMLPGDSFSGSGTYQNAGRVAVLSTGTVRHNPTGWHDGSACIEFTPNADTTCDLRFYFDAASVNQGHAKLNFNDPNGISFDYEIVGVNTALTNFSINLEFSTDATSLFAANKASLSIFNNDASGAATYKEFAGRKYTRFRFDSLATDSKCGNWPGKAYSPIVTGTGADYTKPVTFLRFTFTNFGGQTIKIKRISLGGHSTPCVVLCTDNATPDTLNTLVAPLVAKHRVAIGANNAVATFTNVPSAYSRFKRLYAAGWEINGNDIIDRPLGSSVTDPAQMRDAVEQTRAFQLANGWDEGSRVWIANNNSTSYLMMQELQRAGYVANRNGISEGRYCFPEGGMPDKYLIPAPSFDGMTFAQAQPYIDRCIEYGATLWVYFHNVLSTAQINVDRTNNITGTSGAPIAVNAGETPAQYRARAAALGTAVGNATVTYLDQRIGTTGAVTCVWWEELKQIIEYIATKQKAGDLVTRTPSDWCRDVGLL